MAFLIRSNLRQLIIILALLSTLVTVVNMFLTGAKVQKQALINSTLQSNKAYATKLAKSTDIFLKSTQSDLQYSAKMLAKHWNNQTYLNEEVLRISRQNNKFNSVVLVDADGYIINSTINAVELIGSPLKTHGANKALKSKKSLTTQPYNSALNNLIVMISEPIFTEDGKYLGYIAGSIYLKEENVLNRLLGDHYYQDGSYIYVVDQSKRLLFHPQPERIGETVKGNPIINDVINGNSGQIQARNSEDIDMLSGYAYIPSANWGVVSQRPIESTLKAHDGLMEKVVLQTLPINLLMLALIWGCAWLIANPLRQLAENARNMRKPSTIKRVKKIKAWYFEANELQKGFLTGLESVQEQMGQLREDVRTDPLTGLHNRRTLDAIINKYQSKKTPFSVIALDIDHFKKVNDTYGHDVGDTVLQSLANIMRNSSRQEDYCIRVGGEEFVIVLPNCPLEVGSDIAERLRLNVASHTFDLVGSIKISLGVAKWPLHSEDPAAVLKLADEMLYEAKQGGRNQVRTASRSTLK